MWQVAIRPKEKLSFGKRVPVNFMSLGCSGCHGGGGSCGTDIIGPARLSRQQERRCSRVYERSPLWVISGHSDADPPCQLHPQEQTCSVGVGGMSEKCRAFSMTRASLK